MAHEGHIAIILHSGTGIATAMASFQDKQKVHTEAFTRKRLNALLEEEFRKGHCTLTPQDRSFRSLSSGERALVLLNHIVRSRPGVLLLEDPFDSLDPISRQKVEEQLKKLGGHCRLVFFLHREMDIPDYVEQLMLFQDGEFIPYEKNPVPSLEELNLPPPPLREGSKIDPLLEFCGVSVSYGQIPVLTDIHWIVKPGDFWELRGRNGSGKTTLISLITGDNPKAYGQDITLFGKKKGSGESIWEIKKELGYISPAMTDLFKGYHTCEEMLISGLVDSIGLYTLPTDQAKRLAAEWLSVIGLQTHARDYFHQLDTAHQRLLLCARAMIKQPALLLLDEPTIGLDDAGARMIVKLVNRLADDPKRAVIYVSHRKEAELKARSVIELVPGPQGSKARILA